MLGQYGIKTVRQQQAIDLMNSDALHIFLYGGSRSGKTFIALRQIALRAMMVDGTRHLAIRYRFNHIKQAIWYDTFPKMMSLCFPGMKYSENKSDWFWKFTNGSELWIGGLDDKERTEKILGQEYSTIFFNECSQMSYDSVLLARTRLAQNITDKKGNYLRNQFYYDCNPPSKKHWTYLFFKEFLDPNSRHVIPQHNIKSLLMNPSDNTENLPADYLSEVLGALPHRQRARFLDGLFLDDNERALWKRSMIDPHRIKPEQTPPLSRIVVAVDPAVTSSENSDETGIVVCGEGRGLPGCLRPDLPHYYVLDDLSLKGTPHEWARTVADAYNSWRANRVIGETNNGGDLIEANIRNINPNLSYKGVHASRGKMVRAEPVSALYEQGRVHHVGDFFDLEGEMTSHEFTTAEPSPNRLDALVWGLSYLGNMQFSTFVPAIYPRTEKTKSKVRNLPL